MQRKSVVLSPPPVLFIKSISEQGYTLSTAMADLIDNSIAAAATRIEILMDTSIFPLSIYIADNGNGMDTEKLTQNMRIPSADMEETRTDYDLGRFGLGLKTASFSQSRRFCVISRPGKGKYEGRTWDVEYLKQTGDWTLIIESEASTEEYVSQFISTSKNFHSQRVDFVPNTLIVWNELYKLKKFRSASELNTELDELRCHLGLVFHRFIQDRKLEIRLNNVLVEPFDPFPLGSPGTQTIADAYWNTDDMYIKFQGIILPKHSEKESTENGSIWAPSNRTLEELQGIYVYRNERLVNYGGWLRMIPKASNMQFGRIKIDITNLNDQEFQLNVAKSSLKIPFLLKRAMSEMISNVTTQAIKEYRDRVASNIIRNTPASKGLSLITKEIGTTGAILRINQEFELVRQLKDQLSPDKTDKLTLLMHLLERRLNEVWGGETNTIDIESIIDESEKIKIIKIKKYYEEADYSWKEIKQLLIESFGQKKETISFIDSLNK